MSSRALREVIYRAQRENPSGLSMMQPVRPERLFADDQESKTTPTAKIPKPLRIQAAAPLAVEVHEEETAKDQQPMRNQSRC